MHALFKFLTFISRGANKWQWQVLGAIHRRCEQVEQSHVKGSTQNPSILMLILSWPWQLTDCPCVLPDKDCRSDSVHLVIRSVVWSCSSLCHISPVGRWRQAQLWDLTHTHMFLHRGRTSLVLQRLASWKAPLCAETGLSRDCLSNWMWPFSWQDPLLALCCLRHSLRWSSLVFCILSVLASASWFCCVTCTLSITANCPLLRGSVDYT